MCLIIKRDPEFTIPYEKFKSALVVNPDGYGLSYPDNGGLVTLRDPYKADPEKLYRLINEDLFDKDLLIHLRFNTVGETNLRNTHPFPILERKTDGVDLRMAHNGTLFSYKAKAKNGESDTRVFVREFVRPLFKRMAKAMDPEELLSDTFIKQLLEDKLSASSVLTFLDSNGNSLICNAEGNGGKQDEGWYYSNVYSFNKTHREPAKPTVVNYPQRSLPRPTYQVPASPAPATAPPTNSDGKVPKSFHTQKFTDKYKIDDPKKLLMLSDGTIETVIKKGEGDILIKELIYEMDKMTREIKNLKRKPIIH
jgi:predicted glutamine amidotransferase